LENKEIVLVKRNLILAILLTLIATLLLAACGGQASGQNAEIDVDMKEFTFEPASVTVPAGAEVKLNLKNSGTLEHSWIIMLQDKPATIPFDADDEPNIYWQAKLDTRESETLTFTAPSDPGEYELVCGVPAHLEAGMKGTLIVAEP
jgi:plastocyanin